jgi:lipopolysaccharide transport system permease protein
MSPRQSLKRMMRALRLSAHLFQRTVGARYRRSFFGYFWMLAPPLFVSGVATLAVNAGALNVGADGLPRFLFTTIGVVVWMTFAEGFETPHAAIEEARPYITRINFPRESVLLAKLYEGFVTTSVRFALLVFLLVVFGRVSVVSVGCLAAALASAMLVGVGAGALFAPFSVLFTDLRDTMKLLIANGIFASPALYTPHKGVFGMVVNANPLAPPMVLARQAAAGMPLEILPAFLTVLVAGVLLTVAGISVFRLSSTIIVERMLLGGR